MCLSKRDDQTLATMGRIASYKPKMASEFAHRAIFDNNELKSSVIKFWDNGIKADGLRDKESFCVALYQLSGNVNDEQPFDKLIIHWIEVFNESCDFIQKH